MELLTLTTPSQPVAVTTYTVQTFAVHTTPPCIDITVVGNTGNTFSYSYTGALAATRLTQLNQGNFSVNSLQKQIIQVGIADGFLPVGTVSGVPQ